ncbi:uncharacterized protein LOC101239852 isoform X3 [Hydra vulgaris]|uniref:uncharacterized protein LOC101239852 isoform X3 n=1 Tax=Hydra vulgaris TaxID=6087 RepID=UPI001F5ECCD9|nr:phosphatidylinositol 3,4,5-trisphosphate 3-phosphatase and protein-tyrosine-phosphatase PTEN2B-like isoform X3 [Hydra vulgaris]
MTYIKRVVSKKKRRYIDNEFDLDLSYIKLNIIAMGYPSEYLEGVYRNNYDDVVRFLEKKHKDKYKVYNLCSEKYYEPEKFSSRVSVFGFKDYSAPPFELIEQCCVDMDNWLIKDVENVAIVHCIDGLGRTGIMICAYLLYKGYYDNAKDAMNYYAVYRTENKKGVTIPSQKRYIEYFSYYLNHIKNKPGIGFDRKTVFLKSFTFIGIPTFNYGTCVPSFVVFLGEFELYKSKTFEIKKSEQEYTMHLKNPLPLCGDIKVDFFHTDLFKKERMFVFWFNTTFLEYDITSTHPVTYNKNDNIKCILFSKNELDKANKDKKHKFFPENFKLSLNIVLPENEKEDIDKGCYNNERKQCDDKLKSNGNKNEKLNSSSTDKLYELSDTRKMIPTSRENFCRSLSPPSKKRESPASNKGDSFNCSLRPSLDALTVEDTPTVEEEQLSYDDDEEEEQLSDDDDDNDEEEEQLSDDDEEEEEEQECMFLFGFNTTCLEYDITSTRPVTTNKNDNVKRILFSKNELDKANKDKKHKFFPENFKLSLNIALLENGKEDIDKGCNNKETKQCGDKLKSNGNKNEKLNSSSTEKLYELSDTQKMLPTPPENLCRTLSPPSKKQESPASNKGDSLTRFLRPSFDALTVEDTPTVEEEQLSFDNEEEEQIDHLLEEVLELESAVEGLQLSDQNKHNGNTNENTKTETKWDQFAEGHAIVKSGIIKKRKGLFAKRRQFLLTYGPELYYVDPSAMVLKGKIPWNRDLRPEAKNSKIFFIHTPRRTYYLEDPESNAMAWVKEIEKVHKHYFTPINNSSFMV